MKLQGYYKFILIIFLCNSFYGFSQTTTLSTFIWGIDSNYSARQINTVSTTSNGKTINGKYLTILGKNHSTIIKPYIIVEGIDFANSQYFQQHIDLFNNSASNLSNALIYNLYNNGYDVVILDFDNSTIKIQDNAMLLVQLLKDIYSNNSLSEDNYVVMGYSMGGLVARYALTWMEANGQNHHTRLFVSHDAPQKGANLPLGLQELVQNIKSQGGGIASIATSLLFTTIYNDFPATSQMLIYHYINSKDGVARPSDESVSFFSELYNLNPFTNGYPTTPIKIATSNGNFNGMTQRYENSDVAIKAGDIILDFDYTKDNGLGPQTCNIFQLIFNTCPPALPWAPDQIAATVRAGFDGSQPLEKFILYSMMKHPIGNTGVKLLMGGSGQQTFSSRNLSYDIAPGSYSANYMNLMKNGLESSLGVPVTSVNRTCFIPTTSALDLNIGIDEPFNLNSSQCYTNFDYIYASNSTNNDHYSLQPEAEQFIMSHVLANEAPHQKYVFSAENFIIPANQIVNNNEQYNITAKYTMTNDGAFTVNTGGSTTLVAGQTIELKSGFTVETGGLFSASIGYIDLMCQNPIQFIPRQLATGVIPDPANTSIQKTYDCSNYTEMPNYSINYNYFDCSTIPPQVNTASVDSVLNVKITVFPNPTTGIMNIAFAPEIPINNLVIRIYDYMGNLIYSIDTVSSYNLNFDLPSCLPGLLTVQFIFNNPTYNFSKKILKQ